MQLSMYFMYCTIMFSIRARFVRKEDADCGGVECLEYEGPTDNRHGGKATSRGTTLCRLLMMLCFMLRSASSPGTTVRTF